jgi:murein DD-endopeptidase MepM/ murein hydrolase activator NlpD
MSTVFSLTANAGKTSLAPAYVFNMVLGHPVDLLLTKKGAGFGMRAHPIDKDPRTGKPVVRHHNGVDISPSAGVKDLDVYAIFDGVVTFIDRRGTTGAGKYIKISSIEEPRCEAVYMHLEYIEGDQGKSEGRPLSVGDKVSLGTVLGRMGTTGASTGVHLHFELRHNGAAFPPDVVTDRY